MGQLGAGAHASRKSSSVTASASAIGTERLLHWLDQILRRIERPVGVPKRVERRLHVFARARKGDD
jgi:hypothetical protein